MSLKQESLNIDRDFNDVSKETFQSMMDIAAKNLETKHYSAKKSVLLDTQIKLLNSATGQTEKMKI